MKKENKTTKFVLVVLLITIIALILVAGTYSKYTTKISGSSTGTVAKFVVGSNTKDTFDLFSTTTYEEDATSIDTDVVQGKIAPGTGGKFKVTLTNDSEVSVDYVLSITEENNDNIPIVYSVDGTDYVSAAEFSTKATGSLGIGSQTQQTEEVQVYWKWAFEESDEQNQNDTVIGQKQTAPTVKVTIASTFTQKD